MPDNPYERLLLHLLDDLTVYEEDPIIAERAAVHLYAAVWKRLYAPEEP